jgi:hypothetical protein
MNNEQSVIVNRKSPNHQIIKSPNHQINKSPNQQINYE